MLVLFSQSCPGLITYHGSPHPFSSDRTGVFHLFQIVVQGEDICRRAEHLFLPAERTRGRGWDSRLLRYTQSLNNTRRLCQEGISSAASCAGVRKVGVSMIVVHDQVVKAEASIARYSIEHQMTGQDQHLKIRMEFFPERYVLFYTPAKYWHILCPRADVASKANFTSLSSRRSRFLRLTWMKVMLQFRISRIAFTIQKRYHRTSSGLYTVENSLRMVRLDPIRVDDYIWQNREKLVRVFTPTSTYITFIP